MTTVSLSTSSAAAAKVDTVVVGLAKGPDGPLLVAGAEEVAAASRGDLVPSLVAMGATGAAGEVTKVPASGKVAAKVVLAVGLGPARPAGPTAEDVRRGAGAATRALTRTGSAAFALPAVDPAGVAAVAEGIALGGYAFTRYKGTSDALLTEATVHSPVGRRDVKAAREAVHRATVVAEAVNTARDLVNTPPCDLYPAEFAAVAEQLAKDYGLRIDVLDEKALAREGYGGILAVGQGSAHPPRLLRLSTSAARKAPTLALVGKGITFDSGGLSLKPPDAMTTMKCDMAGAAAVVAAAVALARLQVPVNVIAYAPLAENMPSGTAQRPSDVLTAFGGRTVEVLNTDAEGRLVLADALVRACADEPDLVLDVATLTGACIVALGTRVAGIMSPDDTLSERLHEVADAAGEQMWPLPLPPELREKLDSPVADIANVGPDRWGGALMAALFLKEFVTEGVRWAHLDIAGPAFNEGAPHGYTPKGGTGSAVRTLVAVAEELAAGRL